MELNSCWCYFQHTTFETKKEICCLAKIIFVFRLANYVDEKPQLSSTFNPPPRNRALTVDEDENDQKADTPDAAFKIPPSELLISDDANVNHHHQACFFFCWKFCCALFEIQNRILVFSKFCSQFLATWTCVLAY